MSAVRGTVGSVAVLVCAVAGRAFAGSYAGASEAGELELPGSALRVVAGSASPGLARGAAAVRDNPARMGEEGGGVAATYAMHPGGLTDGQIAAFIARGTAGSFGAVLRMVEVSVPVAVEDGSGVYGGTRGSAQLQSVAGSVSWALPMQSVASWVGVPVRAGLSLTVLSRRVATDSAGIEADTNGSSGVGGGAAVWVPCGSGIGAFVALRDVGWSGTRPWPSAVSAGAALERADAFMFGGALRAALAGTWSRERGGTAAVGVEYGFTGDSVGAALRAGYETGTVRDISPWPSGGLVVRVAGLSVEFGIGSLGGLGLEKIVTISYAESASPD